MERRWFGQRFSWAIVESTLRRDRRSPPSSAGTPVSMDHDTTTQLIVLAFYVLPPVILTARQRPNRLAMAVIGLLLGWTIIAWAIVLVWGLSGVERPTLSHCVPWRWRRIRTLEALKSRA